MSWENERWNRTGANWEEEEDAAELARYHALNNDKDETLYRDNPDYREAYDSIKENSMRLTKSKLRRIIRQSIVETYDGEGRPNWDNEEKLRKAGKFDKSNISKADEEQAAAEIKYREDLRKDYERKLAEIEKMKQDRNARKKGERYRFDEASLRRVIRKIIAEYGRTRSKERKQHWVIVCDWTSHEDPSKHKNGEAVYAEYFGTKANAQRKAQMYSKEIGASMWIESSVEDRIPGEL